MTRPLSPYGLFLGYPFQANPSKSILFLSPVSLLPLAVVLMQKIKIKNKPREKLSDSVNTLLQSQHSSVTEVSLLQTLHTFIQAVPTHDL